MGTLELDEETLALLRAAARTHGVSINEVVRRAVQKLTAPLDTDGSGAPDPEVAGDRTAPDLD